MAHFEGERTKLFFVNPELIAKPKETLGQKLLRLVQKALVNPTKQALRETSSKAEKRSEVWDESTKSFITDPYAKKDSVTCFAREATEPIAQPLEDKRTSKTGVVYWLISFPGYTETSVVLEYMSEKRLRPATSKEVTDMILKEYEIFGESFMIVALGTILLERSGPHVPFVKKTNGSWDMGKFRCENSEWSSEVSFLAFAK